MDVAGNHADKGSGHSADGGENRRRVRAVGLEEACRLLQLDLLFLAGPDEVVDQSGVVLPAMHYHGALAHLQAAPLRLLQSWRVGGDACLDDQRGVRADVENVHHRPAKAVLLLHGATGDDAAVQLAAAGCCQAEGLGGHPRAGLVIERTGDGDILAEHGELADQRNRIADAYAFTGGFAVGGADLDPQVVHGELFLVLVFVLLVGLVGGRGADNAEQGPAGCVDRHSLGGQHGRGNEPDGLKVDEPLVVDVLDHQADLIDVPVQHDNGLASRIQHGCGVAVAVRGDLVGEPASVVAPQPLALRLEAAGRWGVH